MIIDHDEILRLDLLWLFSNGKSSLRSPSVLDRRRWVRCPSICSKRLTSSVEIVKTSIDFVFIRLDLLRNMFEWCWSPDGRRRRRRSSRSLVMDRRRWRKRKAFEFIFIRIDFSLVLHFFPLVRHDSLFFERRKFLLFDRMNWNEGPIDGCGTGHWFDSCRSFSRRDEKRTKRNERILQISFKNEKKKKKFGGNDVIGIDLRCSLKVIPSLRPLWFDEHFLQRHRTKFSSHSSTEPPLCLRPTCNHLVYEHIRDDLSSLVSLNEELLFCSIDDDFIG